VFVFVLICVFVPTSLILLSPSFFSIAKTTDTNDASSKNNDDDGHSNNVEDLNEEEDEEDRNPSFDNDVPVSSSREEARAETFWKINACIGIIGILVPIFFCIAIPIVSSINSGESFKGDDVLLDTASLILLSSRNGQKYDFDDVYDAAPLLLSSSLTLSTTTATTQDLDQPFMDESSLTHQLPLDMSSSTETAITAATTTNSTTFTTTNTTQDLNSYDSTAVILYSGGFFENDNDISSEASTAVIVSSDDCIDVDDLTTSGSLSEDEDGRDDASLSTSLPSISTPAATTTTNTTNTTTTNTAQDLNNSPMEESSPTSASTSHQNITTNNTLLSEAGTYSATSHYKVRIYHNHI
jgi:hypothetical protein